MSKCKNGPNNLSNKCWKPLHRPWRSHETTLPRPGNMSTTLAWRTRTGQLRHILIFARITRFLVSRTSTPNTQVATAAKKPFAKFVTCIIVSCWPLSRRQCRQRCPCTPSQPMGSQPNATRNHQASKLWHPIATQILHHRDSSPFVARS